MTISDSETHTWVIPPSICFRDRRSAHLCMPAQRCLPQVRQACGSAGTTLPRKLGGTLIRRIDVAVVERPFFNMKRLLRASTVPRVYMASVREPQAWFYSAMQQWCLGPAGHRSARCRPGRLP